jgi:hypothetical protein
MRILLATIGFVAWLTLPASAQGQCLVGPGADGRPLSFQQWYGVCGAQVDQLCNYMSSITPVAMDLPRFGGRFWIWHQLTSRVNCTSFVEAFFCSAPCGAILPSRPA